jgi:hypothetical protein
MFDLMGYVFKGFIYLWLVIIATVPGVFMSGLTLCLGATALTYILKDTR